MNSWTKHYLDSIEEYLKFVDKDMLHQICECERSGKLLDEKNIPERMNSYERNLYKPLLSNKQLVKEVKYYLLNDGGEFDETGEYIIDGSYNDVLKHKFIHMLLRRLEATLEKD